MMANVPLTSTSLHCRAGPHMFKHHSAECSEKCVYRIKQTRCEVLPTFLLMDRWGLGDPYVEAEPPDGQFGPAVPQVGVKLNVTVTEGLGLWEELFGVRRG